MRIEGELPGMDMDAFDLAGEMMDRLASDNKVVEAVQVDMEILAKTAEGEKKVVDSVYSTVKDTPSYQAMDAQTKARLEKSMALEGTWKYIRALEKKLDYKNEELNRLYTERNKLKNELEKKTDPITECTICGVVSKPPKTMPRPDGKLFNRFEIEIEIEDGVKHWIICDAISDSAKNESDNFKIGDTVKVKGIVRGVWGIMVSKVEK